MHAHNTIDPEEIQNFQNMAEEWWSPHGKFKPLHQLNACRLGYIRSHLVSHFARNNDDLHPLHGLELLDVGCGGGLISEPMARMGANVTAIDADPKTIEIAKTHLQKSGDITVDYKCSSIENLNHTIEQFDVVLALEIVEHVSDLKEFLAQIAKRVKPNGLLCISTMNRTAKAYALAIVGAEYILGLLPKGTHQWKKFVKPVELADMLNQENIQTLSLCGMTFEPLRQKWKLNPNDLAVNYIGVFNKET